MLLFFAVFFNIFGINILKISIQWFLVIQMLGQIRRTVIEKLEEEPIELPIAG